MGKRSTGEYKKGEELLGCVGPEARPHRKTDKRAREETVAGKEGLERHTEIERWLVHEHTNKLTTYQVGKGEAK